MSLMINVFSTDKTLGLSIPQRFQEAFNHNFAIRRLMTMAGETRYRGGIAEGKYHPKSNRLTFFFTVIDTETDAHLGLFTQSKKGELPDPDHEMRVHIQQRHLEGIYLPEVEFDKRLLTPVFHLGHGRYDMTLPSHFKKES